MTGFFANLFIRGKPALAEATPRDATAIAVLHAASFRRGWSVEEFELLLLDNNVIAHRAMCNRKLAGFIVSRRSADEAEILSVAVARARRGRGLAGQLLITHLRRLAALGVRSVFLEVDEHNEPATKLYRRAGFHAVGRRPNYYPGPVGDCASALILRRDL